MHIAEMGGYPPARPGFTALATVHAGLVCAPGPTALGREHLPVEAVVNDSAAGMPHGGNRTGSLVSR